MEFKNYWNETHKKHSTGKVIYDNWLDKYTDIFNKCHTPILDLGCGVGNDTLYFLEKGFKVIACDYSEVALEKIKQNFNNVETKLIDIALKLPFKNESFDIIVADLSLHYFDESTTKNIMKEIKRILTPKGTLFARVNSINDSNYGANKGIKIEDNFYFVNGYNKRFFTLKDAEIFFSIIGNVKSLESDMYRYSKPKKVIELVVNKT